MTYRPHRVVVVGVAEFPAWERAQRLPSRSLDVAGLREDVDAWVAWAQRLGAPVEVLRDRAATLSAVKARLADLAARARRGEDVWFIWCGRGGVNAGRPVLAAWDSDGPPRSLSFDELRTILDRGAGAAGVRLVIDADHLGQGGFAGHRALHDGGTLAAEPVRVRGVDTLLGSSCPERAMARGMGLPPTERWSGRTIGGLEDGDGELEDPDSDLNLQVSFGRDLGPWSEIDGSVVGVNWYTDTPRGGQQDVGGPGGVRFPSVEVSSKVFELAVRRGSVFERVGFTRVTYEDDVPTAERWHLQGRVWPTVFYLRVVDGPEDDAAQRAWDAEYDLAATEVWHAFNTSQVVAAPVPPKGQSLYDITAGSDRTQPTPVGALVRRSGTVEVLAFYSRGLERFTVPRKGWLKFSKVGSVSGSTWYAEESG